MMANPTEADLKPGYKSVESPKSHHTGGADLSGGDVFVDGNPNYQITRGSDIGTRAGGIGTGKHHHSGLGDFNLVAPPVVMVSDCQGNFVYCITPGVRQSNIGHSRGFRLLLNICLEKLKIERV